MGWGDWVAWLVMVLLVSLVCSYFCLVFWQFGYENAIFCKKFVDSHMF